MQINLILSILRESIGVKAILLQLLLLVYVGGLNCQALLISLHKVHQKMALVA